MTTYTHKHHIIPRHAGGTDDPSNLIELTVEEHAEAHKKLWEEHGRWQDEVAWKALSGQIGKEEAAVLAIKRANTGRKRSETFKRTRSEQYKGSGNPFYGKKHTQESKSKMVGSRDYIWSDEQKKHRSSIQLGENNSFFGRKHSDETRRKMREAALKRSRSTFI